jgi:formylglycine-generating enzyme required for sulfatase activity
MIWLAGGSFTMGSDDQRPEERVAHRARVSGFWIDRHEVTNAQFARFVEATGYRTTAERGLDPATRPDLPPELLAPGSMVFAMPAAAHDGQDLGQWWRYVPGASWRAPLGPGSTVAGKANHPVVHVARDDALAYARWLGRDLPTEAEWEFAARGGLEGADYAWGDTYYDPAEGWRANTWQGSFPVRGRRQRRPSRHGAGRLLRAERPRPVRHGRQRLGVRARLVRAGPCARGGGRPWRAGHASSSRAPAIRAARLGGDQGRLVAVRPDLLCPLPPQRRQAP